MGIQHLNSYLKKHTTDKAIVKMKFKDLAGKSLAIDASIYLYRFITEDALLENVYNMIVIFRSYDIIPIFVFDGIAPIEKTSILEKRHKDKSIAEKEYNIIKTCLKQINKDDDNYIELYNRMIALKKKFVRLKHSDFVKVQQLITAFGINYIEAKGEADEICAKLVIKKYAYACLSEDMDMFIYGCPRVLRYLSLINETVVIYYLDKILADLTITFKEFKEICILSGTDYSSQFNNNTNLYKTFEYFKLYKKNNTTNNNFYEWLEENGDYITNIYQLYNIYNIFKMDNINLKQIKVNLKIKEININKIKEIMKPEGFIFINKNDTEIKN